MSDEEPKYDLGVLVVMTEHEQVIFCDDVVTSDGFLHFRTMDLETGELHLIGGVSSQAVSSYHVLPAAEAERKWMNAEAKDGTPSLLSSDWANLEDLMQGDNPYTKKPQGSTGKLDPFRDGTLRRKNKDE